MKKSILALSLLCMLTVAHAKSIKTEQPPFSVPVGYEITSVKIDSEFDVFKTHSSYRCYESTTKDTECSSKFDGFTDDNGTARVEGVIKSYTYEKKDGERYPKLLIQRNYISIIEALGGKKHAYRGNDDNMTVYLLEKQGQKTWILLDTAGSYEYVLTTVVGGGYKSILTASKFAEDIAKQGYVALNVNFDTNKSIINDKDKPTLNEVVTLLKNDPTLKLSVDGYTDNVGNAAANKTLSQQRSESIVKYLTSNGVAANRLVAKGFGSESPVADNRSEEGKAKNRRVELVKF